MRARGEEVRRLLIEEGACVFIAGSATSGLPEDCRKTLVGILGGEGAGGGEASLAELERAGRLVVEAW
jgi:sulfite reductase alpha subunit-like flavoprotein